MSSHDENDELGRRLTTELRRRTDGLHDQPLGFDDVRGRAVSIRRRRRWASGVAVAAAVAVIVPVSVLAARTTNSDGPLPPATHLPTATTPAPDDSSSPAVPGPRPHALDTRGLPSGPPPAIAVFTQPLDGTSAFATTAEAKVRATSDGVVVEVGGKTFGPYPSASGLARNAAGTAVAWATDDGTVMAWQDGASEPSTLRHLDLLGVQIAAVTGDNCFGDRLTDCRVWVSGHDQAHDTSASLWVAPGGATGQVGQGILEVTDADESGRVLGATEIRDGGTCSSAIDGSTTLMSTCDHLLTSYSPSGDYILATDAYGDGDRSSTIAVYATNGDLLSYRSRTGPQLAGYRQAEWEDDTHVLLTTVQGNQWAVVRMDVLTGALELAVAPVTADPYGPAPFVLETR